MFPKFGKPITLLGFAAGISLQIVALSVLIGHVGAQPATSASIASLVGIVLATGGYIMPRLMTDELTRSRMAGVAGAGFICASPAAAGISWGHAIFVVAVGIILLVASRVLRGL